MRTGASVICIRIMLVGLEKQHGLKTDYSRDSSGTVLNSGYWATEPTTEFEAAAVIHRRKPAVLTAHLTKACQ